jgi:D-beta-D-heptose 7-phosphate kinase/D-beta-D-heptose 1-phosphate adenosyltransferase
MRLSEKRVLEILSRFRGRRILVVGDVMLDRYYWGLVARISPEAPVPVVEIHSESTRLGGASNVALNLAKLGAVPFLVGVVGKDGSGRKLRVEVKRHGLSTAGIHTEAQRATTVKTRVIAHHQHVVRVDRESRHPLLPQTARRIGRLIADRLPRSEAVLIEDYNKGMLDQDLIQETIRLARRHRKPVMVDPKFDNFFDYRGATLFKPTQKEVESVLGTRIRSRENLLRAGRALQGQLGGAAVLLTRGEQGMTLFERSGAVTHIPTVAKEVYDVSGAGDTTIAVLTLSAVAGASLKEAAVIANQAAGIEVGKVGISPVELSELRAALLA